MKKKAQRNAAKRRRKLTHHVSPRALKRRKYLRNKRRARRAVPR